MGDNFTQTAAAILSFPQGIGPLPELTNWAVPVGCSRRRSTATVCARVLRGGTFAEHYGDKECLVELACWGPVVQCNIVSCGAINHTGGCMKASGPCIRCTMPGFPDKFVPFYQAPPGSMMSSKPSGGTGAALGMGVDAASAGAGGARHALLL